jgi:HSP20 family protein
MPVVKWEPVKDLIAIKERMNRIFEESIARSRGKKDFDAMAWSPPVDIYEHDDCIVLMAELPGLKKSDIDIQMQKDTLILKGERKRKKESPHENYLLLERSFGTFTRIFNLPNAIQRDGIEANYRNGILELILPKAKQTKPKKIRIAPK